MSASIKETDRRIIKLIQSTFETGMLCSAMAFLDLAFYLRDNSMHMFMYAYCILDF
jgi:hypothetical protein